MPHRRRLTRRRCGLLLARDSPSAAGDQAVETDPQRFQRDSVLERQPLRNHPLKQRRYLVHRDAQHEIGAAIQLPQHPPQPAPGKVGDARSIIGCRDSAEARSRRSGGQDRLPQSLHRHVALPHASDQPQPFRYLADQIQLQPVEVISAEQDAGRGVSAGGQAAPADIGSSRHSGAASRRVPSSKALEELARTLVYLSRIMMRPDPPRMLYAIIEERM